MSASGSRRARRAISRRDFLRGTGAVIGGGAALGTGALVALGGSSTGPAAASGQALTLAALGSAGNLISAPEVRTSKGGLLDTVLRLSREDVRMGGSTISAVTYEGSYPGPTLEIHAGDTMKIALQNDSDEPTNLHTHGLHVSPNEPSDDVLISIDPGSTYHYEYDLPDDHPGGTYWYHSHEHELSDNQVFGGQYGLLIVRGEFDDLPGIEGLQEQVLQVCQTQVKDGAIVDGADSSLSEQVTVVNGQYQPNIEIAPGEIQRWRIMNINPVFYRFELEGHDLHVVAYDGNSLTEPRKLDILELGPGMRADVLVQGGSPGTSELRSTSWDSMGPFWESMVPVPQTIAKLVTKGTETKAKAELPTALLPMVDLRDVTVDRTRRFRLEEREPRHVGPADAFHYYINGTRFDHDVVNETMKLGTTEEWEIHNLTYEPHPLHIHVNPFQVVAINGQPADENHYRDTAIVPPFGSLTFRTQFLDYTGKFVMHCHILFHEDQGMMQLLEVVD